MIIIQEWQFVQLEYKNYLVDNFPLWASLFSNECLAKHLPYKEQELTKSDILIYQYTKKSHAGQ